MGFIDRKEKRRPTKVDAIGSIRVRAPCRWPPVRLGRGTGSNKKPCWGNTCTKTIRPKNWRTLRRNFLIQLLQPKHPWKGWYYFGGLLAAMGAVYLIIDGGIAGFGAVLLVIGLPAVWLWYKDDRRRKSIESAYQAVVAELEKRGEY
jgi:hypothetical protein